MATKQRLLWIDWMKVIAMYLIIAGHCNVPGNKYIYVFSVPCFFILSGFLTKRESDIRVFWGKILWNLVVPMGLLFCVNVLFSGFLHYLHGDLHFDFLWRMPLNALLGFQGEDLSAGGLGALWFVYTLVLCRIILQFTPHKREITTLTLLNVVMLIGAIIINKHQFRIYSSFANVLLSMPFFTIGYFIRPMKAKLETLRPSWLLMIMVVGIVGVWLCGRFNDIVYLYCCSYGSSILLCFLGAVSGTATVYAISMLLKSQLADFVRVTGGVHS